MRIKIKEIKVDYSLNQSLEEKIEILRKKVNELIREMNKYESRTN